MQKFSLSLLCLLFSPHVFALFCPTNFSTINFGDSITHVQQLCGNANSQRSFKKSNIISEEWDYYVQTSRDSKATAKMSIIFRDDKVININIAEESKATPEACAAAKMGNNPQLINLACNNLASQNPRSVSSTTVCGAPIRLGDSTQTVEQACGKAIAVNQNRQPNLPNGGTEFIELTYNGSPTITLVFENGILKENK